MSLLDLLPFSEPLRVSCAASVATGAAVLGLVLGSIAPLGIATGGLRCLARQRALRNSALFRMTDILLRQLGAWLRATRQALPGSLRRRIEPHLATLEEILEQSGYPAGLDGDQFVGVTLFVGGLALWFARSVPELTTHPLGWALPPLALVAPFMLLNQERGRRLRLASKELPAALDLTALCVTAGLDLPSALRTVVRQSPQPTVLTDGLSQVLFAFTLGQTRREAWERLARTLPAECVVQFVRAVTEAERRGTPLGDVLSEQAQATRTQRSVRAEELAARAGVLMIVPAMMLAGCVLILLMSPFLCTGFGL
jgi:tight adherence protein C